MQALSSQSAIVVVTSFVTSDMVHRFYRPILFYRLIIHAHKDWPILSYV